ncbi:MAG TPA: universal stress protein [Polyangiales bacterium]|nr:universal stress protein [Polyangiales bacterium]
MSKKILVATDFSELGRAAITAALELARALDAKLDVLHVFTLRELPDASGYTAAQMQQHEANARADLQGVVRPIAAEGRLGEGLLQFGDAAAHVLRSAAERSADLIVLGSHGRRGLSRIVLGSTAEEVVRGAEVPVLVVKQGRAETPLRALGVAVDLGPESERVVTPGIELAQALGGRAHLLHAYAPEVVPTEFGSGTVPLDWLRRRARESLLDLASPYQGSASLGECAVELGDPTTVILELAESLNVDLLVLGTEAKRGLTRLVVGSVAESVLRQAPIPVLIIKHRR